MKASAIERNVLEVVSKNSTPMSVHDIALKVKTMRHKINPVINALAKEGKLEIIEGGEIPLFVYREGLSAKESQPEPKSDLLISMPTPKTPDEPKDDSQEKLSVNQIKTNAEHSQKVSPISRGKDYEDQALQVIRGSDIPLTIEQISEKINSPTHWVRRAVAKLVKENTIVGDNKEGFSYGIEQAPSSAENPETSAKKPVEIATPKEATLSSAGSGLGRTVQRILEDLSAKPSQLGHLFDEIGDIKSVLDNLEEEKLIDSTVIWRGERPIYEILDSGREYLHQHQAPVETALPQVEGEAQQKAEAQTEKAPFAKAQPKKETLPSEDAPPAPQAVVTDDKALLEISELVARLVDERIARINEEKKSLDAELSKGIQGSLMEATSSLKNAIDSLNKLSEQLSQAL